MPFVGGLGAGGSGKIEFHRDKTILALLDTAQNQRLAG